jgi:Protein of unknown function (DUF3551)
MMRGAILALMAFGALYAASPSSAAAFDYPYCLQHQRLGTSCSYTSYNQCMASASGLGAECIVNPIVAFGQRRLPPQRQWDARRGYYH